MDLFNLLLFKLSGGKIGANSLDERLIYKAMAGGSLPSGYKELPEIDFDGTFYYVTSQHLTGEDNVTMTLSGTKTTGQNVFATSVMVTNSFAQILGLENGQLLLVRMEQKALIQM